MLGLALVVGDHAARDAELLGELVLCEAGGLAQRGEPRAEAGLLSVPGSCHSSPPLTVGMRTRVQAGFRGLGDREAEG